jgi:glycosyltransferase involved in cell wall biosynthesis
VSVEAAKWTWALGELGFTVRTVAGEAADAVDVVIPGLGRELGRTPPKPSAVEEAIGDVDVVVVENLLSLPLNPDAAAVVSSVLRGRPAVLRHHDLAWQRPQFVASGYEVPDDRRWAHVVINSASAAELGARGVDAVVLHNRFPVDGWRLHVPPREGPVVLHPVRAIARKNVPTALRLAEALDATYWLTGPAEDGYEEELAAYLRDATCPVRMGLAASAAEAYAACDVVAFPSLLEGFGNPVIESAFARRPLAVHRYPVLVADLEPYGFRWFDAEQPAPLRAFLDEPDKALLDRNESIARSNFGLDRLPSELGAVLERVL